MQLTTIQKTMSSLEIAELTDKRHDHVMTDIKKMFESLGINAPEFSGTQTYGNNNTREVFNLPKRETLILVSGYSIDLRAKIIDRWDELESQKQMSSTELLVAQAQALLDIERKQAVQDKRIEQLENKIEKRITEDAMLQLVLPSQLGKMFEPSLSGQKINIKLREAGLQWKVGGEWIPTNEGRPYSSSEPVRVDNGKIVYQLKWQRRVGELLA